MYFQMKRNNTFCSFLPNDMISKSLKNYCFRTLESEHRSLIEKITAFEETLKAKDEVVMSLSNQLQEFHSKQNTIQQFGDTGVRQGDLVSIPCQVCTTSSHIYVNQMHFVFK